MMIPALTVARPRAGSSHLNRVSVTSRTGASLPIDCDLLVLATGGDPAIHLVQQAGARGRYDTGPAGVSGSTSGTRITSSPATRTASTARTICCWMGAAPAWPPRESLGPSDRSTEIAQLEPKLSAFAINAPQILDADGGGKRFVCVCEDVTEKDVCDAVAEGFDNIETLKRYSTVSMGPCQGKMCQMAAIAICARQTSRTIEETGTTTARPPYNPITLGVLAGRNHHAYKIMPTHSRHLAMKAQGDQPRRLAPSRGLHHAGRGVPRRSRARRAHRRQHARLSGRPRSGRGEAARARLHQRLVEPQGRSDALRRDVRRCGHHLRRWDLRAAGRGSLLPDHHDQRRRHGLPVAAVLARREPVGRVRDQRHLRLRGGQPRRSARPRGARQGDADQPRLGVIPVSGLRAGNGRRRAEHPLPDRVRRRAWLRDSLFRPSTAITCGTR